MDNHNPAVSANGKALNENRHGHYTHGDVIEQFKTAMLDAGISPPDSIIPDGNLHRAKDETGRLNIAYCLHINGRAAGYFENFRLGIKETWKTEKEFKKPTPEQRREFAKQRQVEAAKRQHEEAAKRNEAEIKACFIWAQAKPAQIHPYLARKNIKPNGARLGTNGALIIPIFNANLEMVNLQLINEDGVKRFLAGGQKRGCFYPIGALTEKKILIAEGFATGASIQQDTGHFTVVAFDSGNLEPVAKVMRAKYQTAEIILMADNDISGVGQSKARAAALSVGGACFVCPVVGMDFNDYLNQGRAA